VNNFLFPNQLFLDFNIEKSVLSIVSSQEKFGIKKAERKLFSFGFKIQTKKE
jgi:hypothetical protein